MKLISSIIKNKNTKPIIFILVCFIAVFYQVIFSNKTLTSGIVSEGLMGTKESDNFLIAKNKEIINIIDRGGSAWQDEPLTVKVANVYKNNSLPLWNKNAGLGKPLAADMMSMAFSIFRIPLFVNNSTIIFDLMLMLRILIGGIIMYLFLKKLRISELSAATGSLIYILSGYFIYYANMGHLYIELTIPLLFYSLELIIEKRSFFNLALFSSSIIFIILGGHPESAVISIIFLTFYLLSRLINKTKDKQTKLNILITYIFLIFISIGLMFFIILPFLEFYINSDVGIHNSIYKLSSQSLPPYIFVLQFFPILIRSSLESLNNNYWSPIVLFLIIIGLFNKKLRSTYLYFFIFSMFCIIKVYSNLFFEWIGFVPIFNNFVYYKYLQPEISFSFAVMSCVGLEYLRNQKRILKPFITGLIILIASYFYIYFNISKINYAYGPKHLLGAVLIPSFLLICYFLVKIISNKIPILKKIELPFIFLSVIAVLDLVVFSPKDRPLRGNPYIEPKYVNFLKKDLEPYRVFSTDQIMYPATSSVFNIDDIRDIHAVYPRLYMSYIKNFIDSSVTDRFSEYKDSTKISENKFFDMINVKYILSYRPLEINLKSSLTKKIIEQNNLDVNTFLTWFNIDHKAKIVLFEHPPKIISYKLIPDKDSSLLNFSIGMDPKVWASKYGDGVWFNINGIIENKKVNLYQKFIDPKNNPNDRKWFDENVDLTPFLNKEVILELITSENSSNAFDWAGWGNLNLSKKETNEQNKDFKSNQFSEIYNDEIMIYKNNNSFPRAFIVYDTLSYNNEDSVIEKMKSTDFDPKKTAIIISEEKPLNEKDGSKILNNIKYIKQNDNELILNASTEKNGYLVISNIFYPGWEAYIDGKKTNIIQTNLAFSGLFLPEGTHEVMLKYNPKSYKIGLIVSFFSLIILIIYLLKQNK